jgi:hypothetical protein
LGISCPHARLNERRPTIEGDWMTVLGYFRSRDPDNCLGRYQKSDGIVFVSDSRSYAHAESDYDAQYGHPDIEFIEESIGTFVLNALPRIPSAVLELA